MDTLTPFFGETGILFYPPDTPSLCQFADLIDSIAGYCNPRRDGSAERTDLAPDRQRYRMEFTELHALEINLDNRF